MRNRNEKDQIISNLYLYLDYLENGEVTNGNQTEKKLDAKQIVLVNLSIPDPRTEDLFTERKKIQN